MSGCTPSKLCWQESCDFCLPKLGVAAAGRKDKVETERLVALLNERRSANGVKPEGDAHHLGDRAGNHTERSTKKPPARDVLVEMAEANYRIGRAEDERTFIVPYSGDGPRVALFSGQAKSELARHYRHMTGQTVGRTPLDEAWLTIEGIAHNVDKEALPLRVAAGPDAYLDIGDTTGDVIAVDDEGWRIENPSLVTFRRSKAMLPLARPVPGGDLDELFELVPIAPASRELFGAWLTIALVEDLPHPAPVFRGEQGSGKSTAARIVSRLIDPCMADTQRPPRSDEEWAQTCVSRWLVPVDNVSTVPDWWSDALCRTITGDGWLRRQLYTDDEVVVSKWRRCVVLNGITLGASLRPDLAERLVFFELQRPARYRTEDEIAGDLAEIAPRVLGALLDRLVGTIAEWCVVDTPGDLRMADFARYLGAYDAAHGTDALGAYRVEVDAAFDEALAADPIASAVVEFMDGRDEWVGTATALYRALARPDGDGYWPATPHHLSGALSRSAPSLRRVGIGWDKPRRTASRREARLYRVTLNGTDDAHSPLVVFDSEIGERGESTTREKSASRSAVSVITGERSEPDSADDPTQRPF